MGDLAELSKGASTPAHDEVSDDYIATIPAELDIDKFNRGRNFFMRNVAQCLIAMMYSLVCGLSVNNLLDVLVETDQTSTPKQSFFRYVRTTMHVLKWHYGNVWDETSSARKSILAVRKYHNDARALMKNKVNERSRSSEGSPSENESSSVGTNFRKRCTNSTAQVAEVSGEEGRKAYVSQYDMSIVQCGFMGAIIMYPKEGDIKCSKADLDDYVYFWRWIGWLLGIEDHNNICINGYSDAYRICKAIEKDILLPSLENPPEHAYRLAKAFTDGTNQYSFFSLPVYTPEQIIAEFYDNSNIRYPRILSWQDRVRVFVLSTFRKLLFRTPGLAWTLNKLIEYQLGCKNMT